MKTYILKMISYSKWQIYLCILNYTWLQEFVVSSNTYFSVGHRVFAYDNDSLNGFSCVKQALIFLIQLSGLNVAVFCVFDISCNSVTLGWKYLLHLLARSNWHCLFSMGELIPTYAYYLFVVWVFLLTERAIQARSWSHIYYELFFFFR